LNVLADPPTGWIVSIRNNHTRPFSAVVVALQEWRQCSSGDLEHTSEQTPDVLLEADELESNSPALCSRIFEYSSDDSILRVGHSIEESAAGVWRPALTVWADGYVPRIENWYLRWQPGRQAVQVLGRHSHLLRPQARA
jgi:hypothetical protein